MCLAIVSVDIGPADALLDHREGLLVVNARRSVRDQWDAARITLLKAGVDQPDERAITCRCGMPLHLPPLEGVA